MSAKGDRPAGKYYCIVENGRATGKGKRRSLKEEDHSPKKRAKLLTVVCAENVG